MNDTTRPDNGNSASASLVYDPVCAPLEQSEEDGLRPGCGAQVCWADEGRGTDVVLLYLHGLSASHGDGYPAHQRLAQRLGANLLLARLPGHGMRRLDALKGVEPAEILEAVDAWVDRARELGRELILAGTSMGATLALLRAQRARARALLLWSPGVAARVPADLERAARSGDLVGRAVASDSSVWADAIHSDGYRCLSELFKMLTPGLFAGISCPTFVGYSRKDESASIPAMLEMYDQLGCSKKDIREYEHGAHVLGSHLRSRDHGRLVDDCATFIGSIV